MLNKNFFLKVKRSIQYLFSKIDWYKHSKPSKISKKIGKFEGNKIMLKIKDEIFLYSLIKYFANVLCIRTALSKNFVIWSYTCSQGMVP